MGGNRMISSSIAYASQMIKEDEGCELCAYPDPESPLGKACAAARLPMRAYRQVAGWQTMSASPWTIGYGQIGGEIGQSTAWTQAEAEASLDETIAALDAKLSAAVLGYDDLNSVRQAVLIDVAYNVGVNGLLAFRHMLSYLAQGNMSGAARELLDSDAARMLPARYQRLAGRLQSGAMAI